MTNNWAKWDAAKASGQGSSASKIASAVRPKFNLPKNNVQVTKNEHAGTSFTLKKNPDMSGFGVHDDQGKTKLGHVFRELNSTKYTASLGPNSSSGPRVKGFRNAHEAIAHVIAHHAGDA